MKTSLLFWSLLWLYKSWKARQEGKGKRRRTQGEEKGTRQWCR